MLEVKPYKPEYKEDLQRVCLNTAYATAYEPKEKNYLLNTYCDYYCDCEGENSFAAVDENGKAQGYIFCAPDFRKYIKEIKPYAKQAKKSGFDHYYEGIAERFALGALHYIYPAHMHIDLNPGFQHQGMGTKMVNTLLKHLKEMNIKGVMLIAGSGNTNAINFYKKFGFEKVLIVGPSIIMGLKLR